MLFLPDLRLKTWLDWRSFGFANELFYYGNEWSNLGPVGFGLVERVNLINGATVF